MASIQDFLHKMQLEKLVDIYSHYIIPRMTRKNTKVIGIGLAVTLSFYFVLDTMFGAPKKLRHIPYQSNFSFIKSLILGRGGFIQQTESFRLPLIDSPENKGIYMIPSAGKWVVHVANPTDAKYVLMKHDKFPKITLVGNNKSTFLGKYIGLNIVTANGEHWKSQRKAANPAFHRSVPIKLFGRLTVDMFNAIEKSNSSMVDISDLMSRWTLDAIGNAGFGFDFKAVTEKDNEWINVYDVIQKALQNPIYFLIPILDTKLLWLSPKRQADHRELEKFNTMLHRIVLKKREAITKGTNQNDALEENEKDLLTLMIETEAKGEGIMSNEELRDNVAVFFLAGHDTTASTLSSIFYYLALYPEIQQKAREEAISILGDEPKDTVPNIQQTKQMTYINQVIKEALRMNCPVPHVFPRVSTEDTVLSGFLIPKGSFIQVDLYNIHRSQKVWTNPNKFDPDRFAENGEASSQAEALSWVPFGGGPRQCIGMNFSLTEQRVLLSMMLRKYKMTLPENSPHKNKLIVEGLTALVPKDLQIHLEKRY